MPKWNCVLSYVYKNYFCEIGLFFQEITFITEFSGSNFLLLTFFTGGKWDFQVADLLLATSISNPGRGISVSLKNVLYLPR